MTWCINRESYESLCHDLGLSPAQVALAWLLSRPGVVGPIIGPRTVAQLDDSIPAIDVVLSPEILKQLDALWPGPGEAPEAWSW